MNPDDRLIVDYLKSWPRLFVSAREIARRAGGKRRFRDEPQWAFPILARLVEQEMIETDALGHYRLVQKMVERKKRRRWVSPQIRQILESSGKNFGETLDTPEDEK